MKKRKKIKAKVEFFLYEVTKHNMERKYRNDAYLTNEV